MTKKKEVKSVSAATADSTVKREIEVNVPELPIKSMLIEIVGQSPLIFHKWSQKAKTQILEKQTKQANTGRDLRDPVAEYQASFYRDGNGNIAFPANNIKQAIVDAARNVNGLHMTLLRGALYVVGDVDDMVPVLYEGKPIKPSEEVDIIPEEKRPEGLYAKDKNLPEVIQMREDMVRLSGRGSSADLRYRGQVTEWSMKFQIDWNDGVLSPIQIINLLNIAGFSCGLGEWRPQKSGKNGMFEVKSDDNK